MLRLVTVEHGQVQGLPAADPRITSFKGIPFAAPPVGENRWRAPQPQSNWEGVLQAFDFAPISMQAPTVIDDNNIYTREWAVDPDLPMDEDCLYLNVWTPAKRRTRSCLFLSGILAGACKSAIRPKWNLMASESLVEVLSL